MKTETQTKIILQNNTLTFILLSVNEISISPGICRKFSANLLKKHIIKDDLDAMII